MALHVAVIAVLWQPGRQVVLQLQSPALVVSLLPTPAAQRPPSVKPQPAPLPLLSVAPVTPPQVPEFSLPTAHREAVATTQATSTAPVVEPASSRSFAPSPPAGPKPVAAGSLRYRLEPAVEVPRMSRRAGEQGSVVLRVVFDAQGRPKDIQVQRGSGFARLDAQALDAMQAARIVPYLEDGHAIEVVAQATLEYVLE
jgi:protein TonB